MSKSDSNQFKGTKGERIAQGLKPENLREHLIKWANEVVSRMPENVSKRQRERFNTACVAFDEETGNMYYGKNGGIDKSCGGIHPDLKRILPEKSLNDYLTTWNCAETDAINQALKSGANLKNIRIYVVNVRPDKFGTKKKSCENCTFIYKGRIKKNYTGWCDK